MSEKARAADHCAFYLSQVAFWRPLIDNPSCEGEADVARWIVAESEAAIDFIQQQKYHVDTEGRDE